MKKQSGKKYLLRTNLVFTFILAAANAIAFVLSNGDKAYFTAANIYTAIFTGFIYYFYLSSMYKDKLTDLKKEAMFINYPFYIAIFFVCIFLALLSSFTALYIVNKAALNLFFVFNFFVCMIFAVLPSVLLLLFIYFVIPEFILPSKTIKEVQDKKLISISKLLFLLFLLLCFYNGFNALWGHITIKNREKFETAKITMHFSDKYLSFADNINKYSRKKMSQESVNIPFLYTKDAVAFAQAEDAERFCKSLGTRVANYMEAYYIAFNKFDTFGDKYYWTSNKDDEIPLVLHFKDMSYTIERLTENTQPIVYCVSDIDSKYGSRSQKYFYRDTKQEKEEAVKLMTGKNFDAAFLNNILGSKDEKTKSSGSFENDNLIAAEKKHVNFSVKEVPIEIFRQLIQDGYSYNSSISVKQDYETNYDNMQSRLNLDPNGKEVRLCYYPFADYDEMSLRDEAQIYLQSFCSPSFELIVPEPAVKTKYEKDAYCYSRGGRLPNIPELYGILASYGNYAAGMKYWISSTITDGTYNTAVPVLVQETSRGFIKVHQVAHDENDSAFVYCIRNSENPSKVIANYKSRFEGIDGAMYARQKCSGCIYYEIPDVILKR